MSGSRRAIFVLAAVLVAAAATAQRSQGLFSLIRDEARTHELHEAERRLTEGRYAAAVELLLDVLRASPSAVVDRELGNYVGLRQAARDVLAGLGPDARRVYEAAIAGDAAMRLRDALRRGDAGELTRIALRYPHAEPARRARLAAGDRFLERGRILRALQEFSLLGAPGDRAGLYARRLACRTLLGLRVPPDDVPKGLRLPFGEQDLPATQWLRRVRSLDGFGYSPSYWPAYGGGLDGTRHAGNPVDPGSRAWHRQLYRAEEDPTGATNLHAVADGRRVFVNTGTRVYGFDLLTGDLWESGDPIASVPGGYQRQQFLESVSPYFTHSAALGRGIVVAALQVPEVLDVAKENQNFNGIPIMRRLPVRRLHAFEAETGRLVWTHWDPGQGRPDLAGLPLDVSGPPVVIDDTVYVATHKQLGTIALYLSAFDIATGALRWKTLICSSQIEVNMFGNAQLEYAASPLAYSGGTLYGATNLGLCYALRADDGSIRWLKAYRIIDIPRARMRIQLRPVFWANNPPVVGDGVVVITPLDSEDALALETATGRLRWTRSYQVRDDTYRHRDPYALRWLLGLADGRVWFSGTCVTSKPLDGGPARTIATPQMLGQEHGGDRLYSIPRGLLTDDRIYYVSHGGGLVVMKHDGTMLDDEKRPYVANDVGNLCSSAGVLVSLRPQSITAYLSLRELITRARVAAMKHPNAPAAALAYAEVVSAGRDQTTEDLRTSARLYRKVLDLCEGAGQASSSPIALRAKVGLFKKLRKLGDAQHLARPDATATYRREAIELGRELFEEGVVREKDLIRWYARILDEDYVEAGDPMRELVLDRLEKDHAGADYLFGGSLRSKVGAYVLLQRLRSLADTAGNAPRRLALLRHLLVDYGSTPLPLPRDRVDGRAFALREVKSLLEHHGRDIYAPYERAAARLLAESSDDSTQLRVILDQYPLSETAEKALVRLSVVAAKNHDLRGALQAYAFGLTRLPSLPAEMLAAIARAADTAGNTRLRDAFLGLAKGHGAAAGAASPLLARETLHGIPKTRLLHDPTLSAAVFRTLLAPRRVRGFRGGPAPGRIPLLLLRRDVLHAFVPRPRAQTPRYRSDHPDYLVQFTQPVQQLESVLCGNTLVLAEEAVIRGIAVDTGKLLWTYRAEPPARGGDPARSWMFEVGGALTNGLYAVSRRAVDPALDGDRTLIALEPLTGTPVFERRLHTEQPPELGNGWVFRFVTDQGKAPAIVVLDPLTGADDTRIPLDGRSGPLTRLAARHVLVTRAEVFVLVPNDATESRDQAGLWSFSRHATVARGALRGRPRRNWFCPAPRALDGDTFVVARDAVFLTLGFFTGRNGRVWKLGRTTGKRRPPIECGFEARAPALPYGSDAAASDEPMLIIGQDVRGNARLTLLDPSPAGVSWSVEAPRRQVPDPLADFPAPAFSADAVALGVPIERGRSRYLTVFFYRLRTGDMVAAPEIRMKPWDHPADMRPWNGDLIVRDDRNAWVFADMISGDGRGRAPGK